MATLRCAAPCAAQDDAKEACWFDVAALPPLAFDHKLVVRTCLRRLAELPAAAAEGALVRWCGYQ